MTINTTSNSANFKGNGATTNFSFSFNNAVPQNASNSVAVYTLIYTDPTGLVTTIPSANYTLSFNAPGGNLWGLGGTLTYAPGGQPIPNGSSLLLTRLVAYTQNTSISNQGAFYPQVVEQALDYLMMAIQQLAARTGQFRGTWITNTSYSLGDVVIDGTNGANTTNYYMCTNNNTSGVWATDLANGDWTLVIDIQAISQSITAKAGGTSGQQQYNNGGALGGFTQTGDVLVNTSTGVSTIQPNVVDNSKQAQSVANSIACNPTNATANRQDLALAVSNLMGRGSSGNLAPITMGTNINITGTALNVPTAGTSTLGACRADNSTINNSGGVLSTTAQSQIMVPLSIGSIIQGTTSTGARAAGSTLSGSSISPVNNLSLGASSGPDASGDTLTGTWQYLQSTSVNAGNTSLIILFQRTL